MVGELEDALETAQNSLFQMQERLQVTAKGQVQASTYAEEAVLMAAKATATAKAEIVEAVRLAEEEAAGPVRPRSRRLRVGSRRR